jgi:large subunit ribosomal protein L25
MTKELTVDAEPREDFGKHANRRLRRSGFIPAVVYGGGGSSQPLSLDPKGITRILHSEAGHNAIFMLEVKGKAPARVMIRDWQLEPVRGSLLHVDLVRVARDTKLKLKVPIQLTGEPVGVKTQGGVLDFNLREVEVECLPDDIPEKITVDVSELVIGRSIRVSDLPLSDKVKILSDPQRVVAHVMILKIVEEEKPAEVAAEAAPAGPEVIRKGKAEEAEGEAEPEGKATKESGKEKARESGKEKKSS